MVIAVFKTSKLLILVIFLAVILSGCASTTTVGEEPTRQLSQEDVQQCEDGSTPMCITRMGRAIRCSCKKDDMRRVIETRGADDAIFTPTEIPQ